MAVGLAGMIWTGYSAESEANPASVEAATTVRGAGTTLVYGTNHDYYNRFTCAVPHGIHGYRVYDPTFIEKREQVPMKWPHDLDTVYSTFSLRPMPDPLLSGKLDQAIIQLLDTAPEQAELTIWHEAGPRTNHALGYPPSITAEKLTAMHAHMQALVTAHGHVKYGQIIIGPADQMMNWLGKGLDWYGVDIYDNSEYQNPRDGTLDQCKIVARMDQNKAAFAKVSKGTPSLRIPETNSHDDKHREDWFRFLSEWMVANNGYRLFTFWNPDGPLSGPWPPSHAVLDYFNSTLIPDFGRNPTFVNSCVQ
jgi:hypothetical protein